MPRRPTAKRYALAAFEIARESGQIDGWVRDLQTALDALRVEELQAYLELPKVSVKRKTESLRAVLHGVNPMVVNLLSLLASRGSLGLLSAIVDEYQALMDAYFNRERAVVATAVPLEQQQRERLSQQLARLLGKEVVLTTKLDPEVLGGLVARVGDRIIDGSTRGRLMALSKSLAEVKG